MISILFPFIVNIESAGDPSLCFVRAKLIEGQEGLGIFYVQLVVLPKTLANPYVI